MLMSNVSDNFLERYSILLEVWNLINDKYALFETRDICWGAIKNKYENIVKQTPDIDVFEIIGAMLRELSDPHTKLNKKTIENTYISPVGIYPLNGEFYIISNQKNDSKLKRGMKILQINDIPVNILLESEKSKLKYKSLSMVIINVIENLSSANYKKSIILTCESCGELITEKFEFVRILELQQIQSQKSNIQNLNLVSSKEIGNVHYYKLHRFNNNATQLFMESVNKHKDCTCLVVDLRGNTGGLVEEAKIFAGLFIKDKKRVGFEKKKLNNQISQILIEPHTYNVTNNYERIIFVCDNFSASSTEFILLKAVKNYCDKIIIVGTKTAGLPHSATVYTLFNGYKLQVTTIQYVDEYGRSVDEIGIDPDFEVLNDVTYITNGTDYQLKYALELCGD